MRPAGDAPVGTERGRQIVMPERPEEVVLQVVRARPHQLDRPAGRLRDEGRLGDEVVGEATAEAAARARHLDADRGTRDAGRRMHGPRGAARLLQGRDHARAVGLHVHERAGRLERRMTHERNPVARLDDSSRRRASRRRSRRRCARPGRSSPGSSAHCASSAALDSAANGPRVHSTFSALRPLSADHMSSATTATPVARLAVIGSPGFGPGTTTTARTPGTARAAAVVEPRDVAVEIRAAQHDRRARLRLVDIDAVARAARDDLVPRRRRGAAGR